MKHPKRVKRYCKYCKKHTKMKVSKAKKRGRGRGRPNGRDSARRVRHRGLRRGAGNKGKYSKPPIGAWRGTGRKRGSKSDLRFECQECGKQSVQRKSVRSSKLQLV